MLYFQDRTFRDVLWNLCALKKLLRAHLMWIADSLFAGQAPALRVYARQQRLMSAEWKNVRLGKREGKRAAMGILLLILCARRACGLRQVWCVRQACLGKK